jgi:acetylornithine deacetylase/succinyl-diaminopimelate desuccinylase-like protein
MNPVELLRCVLAIPSTPEAARETEVAELFRTVAETAGVDNHVVEPSPGKGSFVASLEGSTNERVLLLAHLDVAFSESSDWRVSPFSGVVRRGAIWGCGAVDAKGLAVVWLASLLAVHADDRPLKRGITLIVAADEESGGALGTEWVLRGEPGLADCAVAFGEGGGYRFRWRGREFVTIQTGECGRVRFRAPGTASVAWVGRYAYWSRTTDELLRSLVPTASDNGTRLATIRSHAFPLDVEASVFCRARPTGDGAHLLSYPPSCDVETALDAFCDGNALRRDELTVESHEPSSESSYETPFFDIVQTVVAERRPRATFLPVITPGYSDNRFLRRRNALTYGFIPCLRLTTARRQHRPNERLPVSELTEAIRMATRLLERLCFD